MRRTLTAFVLVPLISILCIPNNSTAQVGITTMPFLQINNHARSMGVAGATVAMRYHNAGAHLNPATIGNPGMLELSGQFSYQPDGPLKDRSLDIGTPWLPNFDNNLYLYMPSASVSIDKWSFSYQYTHLDLGEQKRTTSRGEELGTFSSYERAHTLTVAYHWNRYISTGLGINFIKSKLVSSGLDVGGQKTKPVKATTFDLGLYGAYPFNLSQDIKFTPSLGWSLTDYGHDPVSYTAAVSADPLPIMMRGGFGLRLDYKDDFADQPVLAGRDPISIGWYRSYSKLLARYDEQGRPMEPWDALFNSWGSYTRFNGQEEVTLSPSEQLMHHSGFEITLFEILSIRRGYFREHKFNGDRQYHTTGFGLYYKYLSLDYIRYETEEGGHPLSETAYYQLSLRAPIKWLGKVIY